MDIVLGVSMAPPSVRMVLVEGENAGGVTVDEDGFEVDDGMVTFPERVVSAILGTQESAQQGGYRLSSTGVTVANQLQAGQLRDALADRRVENVMLVSAFLAAAALAQTVGGAIGYERTALMFIEPDNATLAVVDSSDGSITEVHRVALPSDDAAAVGELTALAAQAGRLSSRPEGLFVVGSGVNVGVVKPELDAASSIPVSVPEEPETALARGAALASAHAPLLDSSTSALAWARDPGTGVIDRELVALGYAYLAGGGTDYDATMGDQALAYSAVADDADSGYLSYVEHDGTGDAGVEDYAPSSGVRLFDDVEPKRARKPFLLASSGLAAFCVVGVASLAVALAVGIRPTAQQHPGTGQHIVVPTQQAPAPVVAPPAPPPQAQVVPQAPAPVPAAPAPAAAPPVAPAPAAPAPVVPRPAAPAPVVPVPAAPAPVVPVPAAPAPVAPIPIPIPIQVPAPAAPAPAPPPIKQPEWPPIFQPPKQSPPNNDNPSWLPGNNGGGNNGGNPSWLPDNDGGGKKGGAPSPWLPGVGGNGGGNQGGNSPWFPDRGGGNKGGGGGGSWFPGLGGGNKGGGGGGGSWFPGLGGGGGHGGGHGGGRGHGGWPF